MLSSAVPQHEHRSRQLHTDTRTLYFCMSLIVVSDTQAILLLKRKKLLVKHSHKNQIVTGIRKTYQIKVFLSVYLHTFFENLP